MIDEKADFRDSTLDANGCHSFAHLKYLQGDEPARDFVSRMLPRVPAYVSLRTNTVTDRVPARITRLFGGEPAPLQRALWAFLLFSEIEAGVNIARAVAAARKAERMAAGANDGVEASDSAHGGDMNDNADEANSDSHNRSRLRASRRGNNRGQNASDANTRSGDSNNSSSSDARSRSASGSDSGDESFDDEMIAFVPVSRFSRQDAVAALRVMLKYGHMSPAAFIKEVRERDAPLPPFKFADGSTSETSPIPFNMRELTSRSSAAAQRRFWTYSSFRACYRTMMRVREGETWLK